MSKKSFPEILSAVETSIKKEGKFDIVRKKAAENIKSCDFMLDIEAQVKLEVEKLINEAPPTSTKESLRSTIKNLINDIVTKADLRTRIGEVVSQEFVDTELRVDVKHKVSKEMGYTD